MEEFDHFTKAAVNAIISGNFADVDNPIIKQLAELNRINEELQGESDRGCALLCASLLDNYLREVLSKILVGSKKQLDSLLGFNGPLGSFSSKINIGYAFGLLSQWDVHDLNIIRGIRNDFGHKIESIDFSRRDIADKCNSLKHARNYEIGYPRKRFIMSVIALTGRINTIVEKAAIVEATEDADDPHAQGRRIAHMVSTLREKGARV